MNLPIALRSVALCLLLAAATAHALTCTDATIPPSNPDSVYSEPLDDGTVTDTRTGLMWKKCSEGQSYSGGACSGTAGTQNWSAALDLAQAAAFAGHADWRLPNFKELSTLVEQCRSAPAINDAIFPNTPSSYSWSGSPSVSTGNAWGVYFSDGATAVAKRTDAYPVRLVRGGQSFSSLAAPGVPTNVAAGAGNARATVSFTAPANNGGSAITTYTASCSAGGQSAGTASGITSPLTVFNLANGTAYACTVTATNGVGTSAPAAASDSVTPLAPTTTTTTTTTTTSTVSSTTTTTLPAAISLTPGWNLVGNSNDVALDVAAVFGDSAKVDTVWKWISANGGSWAFHTPTMTDGGQSYAAAKGYSFLTTINPGEGFWVNAKAAFSPAMPAGTPVGTAAFKDLGSRWSLIAVGDHPTPRGFANGISLAPPADGSVAATSLTTLWTWSTANGGAWYFYAPHLDNIAGLESYAASKGYLDFGSRTLTAGTGFWVNRP